MKRTPLKRGTKMMKRSGFKRKTTPTIKKRSKSTTAPIKGIRKPNLKKLKLELWELCKQITRKKYQNANGTWHCYTCGRLIDAPAKAQTGHGIPSSTGGVLLRYHLNNLRIQDYFCNINLGGNGAEFYRRLIDEIGQKEVDALYILKTKTAKGDTLFFEEKIKEYRKLLDSMLQ